MLALQTLVLTLSALLLPVLGFDLKGSIGQGALLSATKDLPHDGRVILNYGERSAFVQQDGTFTIPAVRDGLHVLQGLVNGYVTDSVWVTIENTTIHVQPYHPARSALSTSTPSQAHPITLRVLAKEDFYSAPPRFNVLALLKSPMVLMVMASGIMMWGMPKLLASVSASDPEMAAEIAATRKRMQTASGMDLMGQLSDALSGGKQDSTGPSPITLAGTVSGASTPSKSNKLQQAQRRKGK